MNEYTCPKMPILLSEWEEAQIFFENGDYFSLYRSEMKRLEVSFYDRLAVGERGAFSPVAQKGFLSFKLDARRTNRKCFFCESLNGGSANTYLRERCIREGGIRYIRLFNEDRWSLGFYCLSKAEVQEGDLITVAFLESPVGGSADSDRHLVRLGELTRERIEKIDLVLENCENFEIFSEEIEEMQIRCRSELEWNSSGFARRVLGGFIRLRLDGEIYWREVHFLDSLRGTVKQLEKRLCGKSGRSAIDICALDVGYSYAGYGLSRAEYISVDDIRPIEEQEEDYWNFVSGYAVKEADGSILIVFGERLPE